MLPRSGKEQIRNRGSESVPRRSLAATAARQQHGARAQHWVSVDVPGTRWLSKVSAARTRA
eukprot:2919975-Alexandrium_andersonii.AAC.1